MPAGEAIRTDGGTCETAEEAISYRCQLTAIVAAIGNNISSTKNKIQYRGSIPGGRVQDLLKKKLTLFHYNTHAFGVFVVL